MGSVSRVSSHCGRTGSLSNGPEPPSPRTSGRIRLFGSAFAQRKFPRGPGRLEVVRAGAVQHDGGTWLGPGLGLGRGRRGSQGEGRVRVRVRMVAP